MSNEDDLLHELNRKIDELRQDVNHIQGDTNIMATLNKERHTDDIINLIEGKFGRSDLKRKCWYYANGTTTISDLTELTGSTRSTIENYVSELTRQGVLIKEEEDGNTYYDKADISTGVGLENRIDDRFDDL
jgi:DNA-binding transcriptional ArsR family regulator